MTRGWYKPKPNKAISSWSALALWPLKVQLRDFLALRRYARCFGNVALAERAAATGRPAHFARFALAALFCGAWSPFLRHLHHFMITFCYNRLIFGTLLYPRPTALQLWFASFWTLAVAHEFGACLFAFLWYTSCLGNVALAERAAATGRPAHCARFALAALFCGAWSPFLRHDFLLTLCHCVILCIFLQEDARSLQFRMAFLRLTSKHLECPGPPGAVVQSTSWHTFNLRDGRQRKWKMETTHTRWGPQDS